MSATTTAAVVLPARDDAFFERVLDGIGHPVFVKDRAFRYAFANLAFAEMLRIPREDIVGRSDHDLFPAHEADWFRAKDQEVFVTEATVSVTEEAVTDGAGNTHIMAATKVPMRGADGAVTHLVGLIHDITPSKRAEEALREVSAALEARVQERTAALVETQAELVRRERLSVIGLFAGSLAHQIRNPLGSIKNAAYLAQLASSSDDADLRRALAIIQDEVARANQIVTDLVDYARVMPPQLRVVPGELLMELAVSGVDVPEGITVRTEGTALPPVRIDPVQLQRAMHKIIGNALRAMGDAGTLTLAARADGDAVFFTVSDTGPGIPEGVRERLFEPLVSGSGGSLGLGLITARALLENQGGALDVDRTGPSGTRIALRVPAAPA